MKRIGRPETNIRSRIKLSAFINPQPSDDELLFLRQLGVSHCYAWLPDELTNYEDMAQLVEKVTRAGLTLYNVGSMTVAKSPNIHLGTSDRDRDIARFADLLRVLSRAGIHTTTFTWEPDQVWSSPASASRFAKARHVDLGELTSQPFTRGREYSLDELWETSHISCAPSSRSLKKRVCVWRFIPTTRLPMPSAESPASLIAGNATIEPLPSPAAPASAWNSAPAAGLRAVQHSATCLPR